MRTLAIDAIREIQEVHDETHTVAGNLGESLSDRHPLRLTARMHHLHHAAAQGCDQRRMIREHSGVPIGNRYAQGHDRTTEEQPLRCANTQLERASVVLARVS